MGAVVAIFAPILLWVVQKIFDLIENGAKEHMKKEAREKLNKLNYKFQNEHIKVQQDVSELALLEKQYHAEKDPEEKKKLIEKYKKLSEKLWEK